MAANQPNNIDEYHCEKNEVKFVTCIYDRLTGQLNSLKLQLAYSGGVFLFIWSK